MEPEVINGIPETSVEKKTTDLESVTVRFCGDSGDGMQLAGTQLTNTSALAGNDVATLPDYPAEIRAPRGTRAGVSGFQIHFAARKIFTPGDRVDALVAMNPAALVTNLVDLVDGGIVVVNSDGFNQRELKLARCETNPLEDGTLDSVRVFQVEMTKLTRLAVDGLGLTAKVADRCRNFYAMGLIYWLYDRSTEPTERYILEKFGQRPTVAQANLQALKAGYHYGETTEAFAARFAVAPAPLPPGTYRNVTGNQALAWGLMAASHTSGCPLIYCTYPITPASDILHELAMRKNFGVRTIQAEDEIAAMTAAIGASFAGAMAATGTSGPGLSLKAEALGLAVMTELPVILMDVQRAGPSTGLPTKTEQSDLNIALFGRHGECPLPVLAVRSPGDCFDVAQEAWRIATRYMTPVIILSDAYVANGSEPWRIPDVADLPPIHVEHPPGQEEGGEPYQAYTRDARLSRPWAIPGTVGLMHRIGGLEKDAVTGAVSHDAANHHEMVMLRAEKIAGIAQDIPLQEVDGPEEGPLLVIGWGGTYGALATAVGRVQRTGAAVAFTHLRYLNPLPANLEEILGRYDRVLIPELNLGQLRRYLLGQFRFEAVGLNKVAGRPFIVSDVVRKIQSLLK